MNPTHAMIVSLAAAALAVAAMLASFGGKQTALPAEPDTRLEILLREHAHAVEQIEHLRRGQETLDSRLRTAETQRTAMPAPASAPRTGDAVATETPPPPPTPAPPGPSGTDRDRLLADLAHVFRNGTRDPDLDEAEQERLWRRLRTTPVVDELIADLEARIERNPLDADARLQLADVYTAKLSTIPGGPEQGVWGGKAERQWQAVVELQPDHWEARFALGFNYSMYPTFVDRSQEAIEHLEVARRLLPTMPLEPRQADVFAALGRMYQRQGKGEAARAALAEGLQRFPDDEGLLRVRQQLGAPETR